MLPCSTKDMPGGDACQLPRGHKGPHDWQGGRSAHERHAKDFFGKSLYVGDEVATLLPHYRHTLTTGTVVKITPKALRVLVEGEERTVFECQVVRAPRQGP